MQNALLSKRRVGRLSLQPYTRPDPPGHLLRSPESRAVQIPALAMLSTTTMVSAHETTMSTSLMGLGICAGSIPVQVSGGPADEAHGLRVESGPV